MGQRVHRLAAALSLTAAEVRGAGELSCYLHKSNLTPAPHLDTFIIVKVQLSIESHYNSLPPLRLHAVLETRRAVRWLTEHHETDSVRKLTCRASAWGVSGWPEPGRTETGKQTAVLIIRHPNRASQGRTSKAGRVILGVETTKVAAET